MSKKLNIAGQVFGKLTVIEEIASNKGRSKWLCRCECGKMTSAMGFQIKRGNTKSCGYCASFSCDMLPAMFNEYSKYKSNAFKRGYAFNISSETFKKLASKPCIYCGKQASKIKRSNFKEAIAFTGIDRKDNSIGYEEDNCVPCCRVCNFGKGQMSYHEYQAHLRQVALHVCKQQPHLIVSIDRFNYCDQEL